MDEQGLFPAEPYAAPMVDEKPVERISAARRLTLRQADAVRHGGHPLALVRPTVRVHPDADPARTASPDNTANRPLRCGTCRWRRQVSGGGNNYPKCVWRPVDDVPDERGRHKTAPPRYSAGSETDVRAWWPACMDYQPIGGGA